MSEVLKLNPQTVKELRNMDSRYLSYNVEMTEVTGGTFWKPYTQEQIDGTEEFPIIKDWHNMANLQQYYEPVDLYDARIRDMAKGLGQAWVRVSGTWANKTYYDFDGHTNGKIPEGYQNLLTKEQWNGVLDFVRDVDAKLLISVANCPGTHKAEEPWTAEQAKLIFDYSREYGVPISAVEFTNEPNMMTMSGLPVGYTVEQYQRDHDLFTKFIRENYPETLVVGPCTVGDGSAAEGIRNNPKTAAIINMIKTDDLFGGCKEKVDIFSYHYYNGVSERGQAMGSHWPADKALSEEYLDVAGEHARIYAPLRDKYCPGAQMWVTESGDAGNGGNTWGSTFMDVFRTLNELGAFAMVSDGVIFHNTFASSDYGLLQHGTFEPRPNYFAFWIWNKLMGTTVYDCGEPIREGAHIYAHSRRDGKDGVVYMIINNSKTERTTVELPRDAEKYSLSAEKLRSRVMCLNGEPLCLNEDGSLPELKSVVQPAGEVILEPATITFFVL